MPVDSPVGCTLQSSTGSLNKHSHMLRPHRHVIAGELGFGQDKLEMHWVLLCPWVVVVVVDIANASRFPYGLYPVDQYIRS